MITVKNELQDDWEDTLWEKRCGIQTWMLATYELKYPFTQNKIFIQTPTQTTCDLKTFETNKIAKNEKWHPKIHNRFQLITKIFFFPSKFPPLKDSLHISSVLYKNITLNIQTSTFKNNKSLYVCLIDSSKVAIFTLCVDKLCNDEKTSQIFRMPELIRWDSSSHYLPNEKYWKYYNW